MQTELHHVQTLVIMAEVFRRGMREEVGLDVDAIGRIFPCLDKLLLLHRDFQSAMRERRQSCVQPNSSKNYLIHRVGDIFMQQVHNYSSCVYVCTSQQFNFSVLMNLIVTLYNTL